MIPFKNLLTHRKVMFWIPECCCCALFTFSAIRNWKLDNFFWHNLYFFSFSKIGETSLSRPWISFVDTTVPLLIFYRAFPQIVKRRTSHAWRRCSCVLHESTVRSPNSCKVCGAIPPHKHFALPMLCVSILCDTVLLCNSRCMFMLRELLPGCTIAAEWADLLFL